MIEITKAVITPMLRLVLEWLPVAGAATYGVRLKQVGEDTFTDVLVTDRPLMRLPAMMNASWYFVQVTARDETIDQIDASEVLTIWSSSQGGTAPLLRQAVYDAIHAGGLPLVDDGYWQPRALGRTAAPSMPLPAIEVGMPELTGSDYQSDLTRLHTWQVPIRIMAADDLQDPDRDAAPWLLFERVQAAVEMSDGLKLTACGVMPGQWSWTAALQTRPTRSKATFVEVALTIPLIKTVGVVLLSQPETIPPEPTAPPSL